MPDSKSGSVILKTSSIKTFNLTNTENWTKKSSTHSSTYCFVKGTTLNKNAKFLPKMLTSVKSRGHSTIK